MTDSIHPENEEIIQNENEELNTSAIADTDEVLETDDSYTDEPSAYDNIEELTEETDETVEEIIEETTDEEIIEELNPDDEEQPEKNNSFFLALKTLVAKGIYEFSKIDKKKRNKYVTIYSIILLLIILVLTDVIPILPNSFHRSYVGKQYAVGDGGRSASESYRKGVIYANDGSVMCFGPDMELISKIDTFSGTPFIRTCGEGAIVYTKNGNKALVMTSEKKQQIITSKESLISASVNTKGDYVLVTREAGYTACVSAYDKDSKPLYKWHTGNNILDTAISPNGQSIVASCVEYSDTTLYSKLVFLDIASKEPVMEISLNSNLATELVFLDKNTVVAIGDSFTTAYTPRGNQKWRIDYDGKLLNTYDISDEGTIAFLFNRYNSSLSESFVEIYNNRGNKIGDYRSSDNVRNISINNNYCLLTLDGSTILISSRGNAKKTKALTKEFSRLELFENYHFAFGITNGCVEIVSVRH